MPERAQVTSIEALESFRASLIVYLSKARPALEEVCDDACRTRIWLQSDRRSHWMNEVRRRRAALEQARQELLSARLSSLREPTAAQQGTVTHAERALREAEDKLRLLKKWSREFENLTDPLTKQLGQLHTFLNTDMRQAIAYLARVAGTLEAYVDSSPAMASTRPTQPGGPSEANNPIEARKAPESLPAAAVGPNASKPQTS